MKATPLVELSSETPIAPVAILKVIGVGGGGGNAVGNMYRENIPGVQFLVCNTDAKALADSPVPAHLQLGPGLGAGGRPEIGRALAENSVEAIREALGDEVDMVFITAGMGGGTGTGAAPVIAREAMNKGILTVGIVTIPFLFEQSRQIDKALDGVETMSAHVDALLVVNNQRLTEVYSDLTLLNAFKKADETLTNAVRSIVDIINMHGKGSVNLDFSDVETCLRGGGVAVMSTGTASGENRVMKAIREALHSPLLNDKDIEKSQSFRIAIFCPPETSGHALMMDEIRNVEDFMKTINENVDYKHGFAVDETLTDEVRVIILASGFRNSFGRDETPNVLLDFSDEEQEHARYNAIRRDRVYGSRGTRPRSHRVYILKPNELENEQLVAALENTPALRRTETEIRNLRVLAEENQSADTSSPHASTT